jgi:hypothetical protein
VRAIEFVRSRLYGVLGWRGLVFQMRVKPIR